MSKTVSRIDRELMRGAGPVAVLQLLSRGEMYGYEMTRELARRLEERFRPAEDPAADGLADKGENPS